MHIHATDPSVAMHRVVRILLFVLCLASDSEESEQLASMWPLEENSSKLTVIHIMRRGAGRGKPDCLQRVPIVLGFKCVHCKNEFDSRHAIDCHCRHSGSVGTVCRSQEPQVHKSTSQERSCAQDSACSWEQLHSSMEPNN